MSKNLKEFYLRVEEFLKSKGVNKYTITSTEEDYYEIKFNHNDKEYSAEISKEEVALGRLSTLDFLLNQLLEKEMNQNDMES